MCSTNNKEFTKVGILLKLSCELKLIFYISYELIMNSVRPSFGRYGFHNQQTHNIIIPKAERTLRPIETNLVGVDKFGLNWSQYAPHRLKLVDF